MNMKAMVRQAFGGPEQLVLQEVPIPVPGNGEILIKIKAFGLNHAELYMRRGDWGDVAKISGIECVGEVEKDPSGKLPKGTSVAAIMGGMGRTRNGSYAEYTIAPSANVIPLSTSLSWENLAAIPESYATAWSCLVNNMKIKRGETVVIRGATSTLGQAGVNIASLLGVTVIATTRSAEKEAFLRSLGAHRVLVEEKNLSRRVLELHPKGVDGVFELIGNSTFQDSMKMTQRHGCVCIAGFLGGFQPVSLDILSGLPPEVYVTFFASFMLGLDGYPVSEIPMQEIVRSVEEGAYKAKPVKVFAFEDLQEAHRLMESGRANGKIVVVVN